MPLKPSATACLLAGITLLLYGFQLRAAPLTPAETAVLELARSHGTPLFFHVADERWLPPVAVYATSMLDAAGAGDASGRAASTIAGALNVALVFVAARLMWGRDSIALAASLLLLLTPAHRALAQAGTDALFPVAFVLAWLTATVRFLRTDSSVAVALAALALGLGVYSHATAPLTMSGLAILTAAALAAAGRATQRIGLFVAVFIACFAPAGIWFLRHPETYGDTFGRWLVLKAHLRYPLDGLRAQVNWNTLGNRTSLFWGFLDPSFLFFAPRAGAVAPFLACSALLLPLGVHRLLSHGDRATRILLLGAALIVPIVAATFGESQQLSNAAVLIAAAALIGAAGVASLNERRPAWRWIAAAPVVASLLQVAASY